MTSEDEATLASTTKLLNFLLRGTRSDEVQFDVRDFSVNSASVRMNSRAFNEISPLLRRWPPRSSQSAADASRGESPRAPFATFSGPRPDHPTLFLRFDSFVMHARAHAASSRHCPSSTPLQSGGFRPCGSRLGIESHARVTPSAFVRRARRSIDNNEGEQPVT